MTDQSAPPPPRQPDIIWDRKYQDFSKAQHLKARAIAERVSSQPVTLSTLGTELAKDVDQMVADADAMAMARYAELAAERNALEAENAQLKAKEKTAVEYQDKLKKVMTDKGIKLP